MQIAGLNFLDMFLLFILFLGGLIGMLRGISTQLASAASIWLALLGALWTYRLLSVNIFMESEMFGKTSADTMSFLIMFIVFFHSIRLLIRYLTKPPEEKKKKVKRKGAVGPMDDKPRARPIQRYVLGPLGLLGGAILGVILTILWSAIILGVMQFFFQVDVTSVPGGGAGLGLANQMTSSLLVPWFNGILLFLVKSLDLFVLDDSADILNRVVCPMFPGGC